MTVGMIGSRPRPGRTYEVQAGGSFDNTMRVDSPTNRSRMNSPHYKKLRPQPQRQKQWGYEGMTSSHPETPTELDRIKRCEKIRDHELKKAVRKPHNSKPKSKKTKGWRQLIANKQKGIPARFARFSVSR